MAEYDSIRAVKQAISIPVIANADIDSPEKAKYVLEYTGADALMIGRPAQGRPWIFQEIQHFLKPAQQCPRFRFRKLKAFCLVMYKRSINFTERIWGHVSHVNMWGGISKNMNRQVGFDGPSMP
jgi:tRNA-dihydrouridine synthase